MFDKSLRYATEMFEIFLRHALSILYQIYGHNKAEKCLIYPQDMPEISVWKGWNKPLICLRHWDNMTVLWIFSNSIP